MEVSVVIPVHNAAPFILKGVQSALMQREVKEIILIEDGSIDHSLKVCQDLAKQHKIIKLFRHPNGENRGISASRNLGIQHTSYPFIAFLDADDFYLENRFTDTKQIFKKYPLADGVYGTANHLYMTSELESIYTKLYNNSKPFTKIEQYVAPEHLFSCLMGEDIGHFHIDTFTVKKKFLNQSGHFDTSLGQSEDTDLFLRMSLIGCLYQSENKNPVATIRIHGNNNVLKTQVALYYRHKLMEKWLAKMQEESFGKRINQYFIRSYLDSHPKIQKYKNNLLVRVALKMSIFTTMLLQKPTLIHKLFK